MNRQQFLRNLTASKVKLFPLQIKGWEGLVYLRPQTMGEIRDDLVKEPESGTVRERLQKDPLFLARGIARVVREENGDLLFDPNDDTQMLELMAALSDTAPDIAKQVNEAYSKLSTATTEEVTPAGNSLSAKPS